jgi:Ca-activated chloride channel family protein
MKIDARLTFDKVRYDQDADAHLVLSLTAPALSVEEKRPPLCIVPVIDVSPSMEGPKLVYAKRSLIKLIDHLSANDYCGLVKFSHAAEIVAKPVRVTAEAKEDLKRKVGELTVSGSTNIADALLTGLSVANNMDLSVEVITRVILFTDGSANTGVATTPEGILALVAPNKGIASVSAFGYGADAQQNLLSDLAQKGNGNYAFVQNPDDALSAFGKELGGLLSTYATNLVLDLSPLVGHQITEVVSDVTVEDDDLGQVTIKIPDLLADETRNIVLAVKLKEQKNAFPREVNVFDVKVGYDVLDANCRKERKDLEAKAKVQFVKPGEEQTKADPELDKIVALAQIVRGQIEAEEHAKQGNFVQAQGIMRGVSGNISGRGLADLGIIAATVGDRMGSRSVYASSGSYLSSLQRGATRGLGVASYDLSAAKDLQTAGVVMSNASQTSTAESFTQEDPVGDGSTVSGADADGTVWANPSNFTLGNPTLGGSANNLPLLVVPSLWQQQPQAVPEPKKAAPRTEKPVSRRKVKKSKSARW